MCPAKYNRTLQFRGLVDQIPICALIDSGSTHSYINPAIIQNLSLALTKTTPLTVRTASGDKMCTDALCQSLKFQLKNHEFEGDQRVLDVQGYDVILGMGRLSSFGPMLVD